ncbi:NAD(P)-binding protein [Peniophora sp. CONT]|nr:NAD(P)-binding protein [Peniophora sp. CONT]
MSNRLSKIFGGKKAPVSVFITSATGLVGASVVQLIYKDPKYNVTALVRSEEKAAKLEKLGVNTVVGSLDNAELMTALAAQSDVVIQIADIFNLPGTQALLKGSKLRFEKTGKKPIYIHTCGTGIWADLGSAGAAPSDKITKDTDADLVENYNGLPHKGPAEAIVAAGKEGFVKTFTVYPPTVWGTPKGPIFDAHLAHTSSIQLPLSIKTSLGRGQGGVVGEGKNVWNHAHVEDVANFYKVLLAKAVSDESTPSGPKNGHYIVEAGEYNYLELAKTYTKLLHAAGKSESAEPNQFTAPEFEAIGFLFILGTNARTQAVRAKQLGWSPKYTTKDFYAGVKAEVDGAVSGTFAGVPY